MFGTDSDIINAREARREAERNYCEAQQSGDPDRIAAAWQMRRRAQLVVMGVTGKMATVDEARQAALAAGPDWPLADLWPGLIAARDEQREPESLTTAEAERNLQKAREQLADAHIACAAAWSRRILDWQPTGAQFVDYVKAVMTSETMDDEEQRIAALLGVPRREVQYSGDQLYVSGRHLSVVTPAMTVEEAREAAGAAGPHWPGADLWVSAASVTDAFAAYVAAVEAAGLPPQYSPREAARWPNGPLADAAERVLVAVMWDTVAGGGDPTAAVRTLARWAVECVRRIRDAVGGTMLHRPDGAVPVVEWVAGSMARALWDAQADPNVAHAAAGLLSDIASIEAAHGITDAVTHYAALA